MFFIPNVGGVDTQLSICSTTPSRLLAIAKQFEAAMVSVAKESLLAAILRLAEEIKEKGLNPTLEKKYQTLLGQVRSVLGKEK